MNDPQPSTAPVHLELTKPQRRALGVLIEKGFTTPEYYPLTLKALTAGCNQKSNRHPLTDYSEDDVAEAVDQLREKGLVAVVHTESGRTERFRHYMRKEFTFSEPGLAILTELMLRGRQQLGELRTRASRMAPIDSLELLRDELQKLKEMNLVRYGGSLDRRGVEVDHNLYTQAERSRLGDMPDAVDDEDEAPPAVRSAPLPARDVEEDEHVQTPAVPRAAVASESQAGLAATVARLERENVALRDEVAALRSQVEELSARLDDLCRQLGM